jgi:hypothetical protein
VRDDLINGKEASEYPAHVERDHMNTNAKITIGVIAGLVAGTTLVGTAFAAPVALGRMTGAPMMGAYRTAVADGSGVFADMQRFMNKYRTQDGRIDMNRMHADVTSGAVTPPHMSARTGTGTASQAPGSNRGYGMMGGSSSAGYGSMMGRTF